MSKIGKSSINWIEMERRVPKDQKTNFFSFKGKSDAYLRRVLANPPAPPPIDWAYYKRIVPVDGLVAKFQNEYKSLKIPYPKDTLSASIDKQWKTLEVEIKKFCAQFDKDIQGAQKELDRISKLPKFADMTMETYFELHPKEALDFVNKPTFWPHTPEEQPGYETPEQKAAKAHH